MIIKGTLILVTIEQDISYAPREALVEKVRRSLRLIDGSRTFSGELLFATIDKIRVKTKTRAIPWSEMSRNPRILTESRKISPTPRSVGAGIGFHGENGIFGITGHPRNAGKTLLAPPFRAHLAFPQGGSASYNIG